MFSIHSAAPTPSLASRTPGNARTLAPQVATDCPDIAALRDELLQMLRDGGAIGDHLRPAVLRLIPTLDDWPQGMQIAFHAGGGAPPECYGSALDTSHEPVHVMQLSGDRFAAAPRGDVSPENVLDCGPGQEGLFDAVLEGMQQRDGWQHRLFTDALAQGTDSRLTDAQRLRERLAYQLEQSHPASVRVLQDPGGPIHPRRDLSSLGRRRVGMANALHAPRDKVTAPLLQKILKEKLEFPKPRSRSQLAMDYRVPVGYLSHFVTADLSPKPMGLDLLWREGQPPVRVLTPNVVQTIATMAERGVMTDAFGLLEAAHQNRVSFRKLQELIEPGTGLTSAGRRFLAKGWTRLRVIRAVNAQRTTQPATGEQRTPLPGAANATRKQPVTADLLLAIRRNGPAWIASHGGLRQFAKFHQVAFGTLKTCVVASTAALTPDGIKKVQKTYPDFAVVGATATNAQLPDDLMASPRQALPDPALHEGGGPAREASATTAQSADLPHDLQDLDDLLPLAFDPLSLPKRSRQEATS